MRPIAAAEHVPDTVLRLQWPGWIYLTLEPVVRRARDRPWIRWWCMAAGVRGRSAAAIPEAFVLHHHMVLFDAECEDVCFTVSTPAH